MTMPQPGSGTEHPFIASPNKTLLRLSLPVLFSLVAEPLTGLVDTGFIARLGAAPLAALGVGTMTLSGIFWAFNFLGIGTQTETAQAMGGSDTDRTRRTATSALLLSVIFGILLMIVVRPVAPFLADLMGADDAVHGWAVTYIQVRLFSAPAVLLTIASFGIFRGRQDMRTPFFITAAVNGLNVILDPLLIFGFGPLPRFGVAGAAWASVISQWFGALVLIILIYRRIRFIAHIRRTEVLKLLRIGRDLFIRTGMITLFLLLATRAATRLGAENGAAHQAIRQIWVLAALFLDAYAVTGQSLVAYFSGALRIQYARQVARLVCLWSIFTGVFLSVLMALGESLAMTLFVPAAAVAPFLPAWGIALLAQPVNSLAFATDGIHWGTGDFRFLRNVVVIDTLLGAALLFFLHANQSLSLTGIWMITALWTTIRAGAGLLRIWPGVGGAPLRIEPEPRF